MFTLHLGSPSKHLRSWGKHTKVIIMVATFSLWLIKRDYMMQLLHAHKKYRMYLSLFNVLSL